MEGIYRAAIEIAYDNGGINRTRTEDDVRQAVANHIIMNYMLRDLEPIDQWLYGLLEKALKVVCTGEDQERHEALKSAPKGTEDLLNNLFNEGCC